MEEEINRLHSRMESLEGKVDTIASQLARQRGFLAGLVFGVSAIWAAVVGIWEILHNR